MRFEKNVTSYTWQRKRQVLELEAIEKDYSYLVPILYEEGYDIANIIMKQYADGDSGKWLVFMCIYGLQGGWSVDIEEYLSLGYNDDGSFADRRQVLLCRIKFL